MKRTPAVTLAALLLAGPVAGQEPAGPPAPTADPWPRAVSAQERSARRAWRWYAAAWTADTGSTVLALRTPGARESSPLYGPLGESLPALAAVKAAVGVATWRAEVWLCRRGHPTLARVLRWIYVGGSTLAAAWNLHHAR